MTENSLRGLSQIDERTPLERAIDYIDSDEYVEATPRSLRLRKQILDATARKRAAANLFSLPAIKTAIAV